MNSDMWYKKLGVVSIGIQSGGRDDSGLGKMKVELWKLLLQHCKKSHCLNVAHYALVLRIGGEYQEFGKEGIVAIRRSKNEHYIGADIVIPESVWRTKDTNQLHDYLATQVRGALMACVARLKKDKESLDETAFFTEVDAAMDAFKKIARE